MPRLFNNRWPPMNAFLWQRVRQNTERKWDAKWGANRSCETTFKKAETNHMKNTIYVESAWNHMGPNLICFSWDHKHGSSSVILKCFRGTCWPNSFSCLSSLLAWNITTAHPKRSLKRSSDGWSTCETPLPTPLYHQIRQLVVLWSHQQKVGQVLGR